MFCSLHSGLGITEKLLIWLFDLIRSKCTVQNVISTIKIDAKWDSFTVVERNGRLQVGGWISLKKVALLLAARDKIIDAAFGN
jgi:hypothetical protein